MPSIKPVLLESHGVRLEPMASHHSEGLFEIGQQADDWLYMPRPCFRSLADTQAWVEDAMALANEGTHISFTIIDNHTHRIAGSSRYLAIVPEHRRLEIGYTWIGQAYQRSHVNTATKLCLLSHAFETLGMVRVEFKADARNTRSQQALLRLGATQEGIFRKHMTAHNKHIRDSVYFSIIDDEWPELKARLESKL